MSFKWMDKPLSEFILLLLKATMVDHFLLENTPKIISVLSGLSGVSMKQLDYKLETSIETT